MRYHPLKLSLYATAMGHHVVAKINTSASSMITVVQTVVTTKKIQKKTINCWSFSQFGDHINKVCL